MQVTERKARVLVVGEVNPFGKDPALALYHLPRTSSGNRLRVIMGLTDLHYSKLVDKVNLCVGEWSMRDARDHAEALVVAVSGLYDAVVLLGAKVRRAFGVPGPFNYVRTDGVWYLTLPHPSGQCRTWNKSGRVTLARQMLARVAPYVPWGTDVAVSPVEASS